MITSACLDIQVILILLKRLTVTSTRDSRLPRDHNIERDLNIDTEDPVTAGGKS